jgi:threonine dehydrogenase-like Zn-dependent dehydrogenase
MEGILPMKALVYQGPGSKALEDRPRPGLVAPTDAIVKIAKTTICGSDLHILKGDVPSCQPDRILGHEGIGVVETVGPSVTTFKPGDRVLISCISTCGTPILDVKPYVPYADAFPDSKAGWIDRIPTSAPQIAKR